MVKIYNSVTELVGHTPLVRLGNFATRLRVNAEILAKCEMYNPLFSVKDRVALSLIENEEKKENTIPQSFAFTQPFQMNDSTDSHLPSFEDPTMTIKTKTIII